MDLLAPIRGLFHKKPQPTRAALSSRLPSKESSDIQSLPPVISQAAASLHPGSEVVAPDGIDFTALWEEPSDTNNLAAIFSGIAAGVSVISLIIMFFK